MDRRVFLVLLLAGCADPSPDILPAVLPSPTPTPHRPEPVNPPTASGDAAFDAWAEDFYTRAVQSGLPADLLDRELKGLIPDPRVITLDGRQPEFSKPVSAYLQGVVTEGRLAQGRTYREALAYLPGLEQRFAVPREIMLAIWAMETAFGATLGDFDVIRSMATLAAQGRRRQFAEDQLVAALRIIGSGTAPRERLRGSWAGAMGQTQFIPTTFLTTAVDGDGDGRIDIWGSSADAMASAANLLAKVGWKMGASWAREVILPAGFDYSLTDGPRETPDWWAQLGVVRADGQGWSAQDQALKAQLALPAGATGPAFLLLPNHFAIRRYNNSAAYALGVGMLADGFMGQPGLVRPWPVETPLSLTDRIDAQKALAALGFSPGNPDGIVGTNTRSALKAWQKARGLVADGYLSIDMINRLRAETGLTPAT